MAPLTEDYRVLIRILRTEKEFNSLQMIRPNEFPNRGWNKRTLNRLIQKNDETGTSSRKTRESVRTASTPANIARVSQLGLMCSQDDDPGTSKSIGSNSGIDRRSVTLNISKRSLLTVGQISVSSSLTERLTDQLSRRIAAVVAACGRHIEYSID